MVPPSSSLRGSLVAEALGTFALAFAGTGASVMNEACGDITQLGVAIPFGLVVMAIICALAKTSGAHINPAVTLAFCVARRFPAGAWWQSFVLEVVLIFLLIGASEDCCPDLESGANPRART